MSFFEFWTLMWAEFRCTASEFLHKPEIHVMISMLSGWASVVIVGLWIIFKGDDKK